MFICLRISETQATLVLK